mgnify:CR=1 FL=1
MNKEEIKHLSQSYYDIHEKYFNIAKERINKMQKLEQGSDSND